jgi:arylsulfatase A-like enzyme
MKKAASALLPFLLVAAGLGARRAAARAGDAVVSYDTPFVMGEAEGPPTEPLTPRVAVVLVDGLGLAASRDMPFLGELRAQGADYACAIGLPSLSLPARAVMWTGAWADVHGQITNHHPRALRVDHLFRAARRRGLDTGLSASPKVHTLFSPGVTRAAVLGESPETAPLATYLAALRRQGDAAAGILARGPGLALVELYAADEAGHGWGAASPEYAEAVRAADQELRRLAAALDLEKGTLIVTGDHGHVAAGGHGGPEPPVMEVPLVMAGRGIRRAVRGAARQVDLAPTVAALLGLPIPSAGQGRPLVEALDAGEAHTLAILRAAVAQRERFVAEYLWRLEHLDGTGATTGGRPPAAPPDPPSDAASARARLDTLDAALRAGQDARRARDSRARRAPSAGLILLPVLVVGGLAGLGLAPAAEIRRGAAAAVVAFALYHAALSPLGLRYSITAINKDEWIDRFFARDMALGFAAAALAAAAAVWPGRASSLAERARQAWLAAALLAGLFVVKIALVYWHNGVFLRWYVTEQYWGFGFYLDVLALMAMGLGAPALFLVAAVVKKAPAGAARRPAA